MATAFVGGVTSSAAAVLLGFFFWMSTTRYLIFRVRWLYLMLETAAPMFVSWVCRFPSSSHRNKICRRSNEDDGRPQPYEGFESSPP